MEQKFNGTHTFNGVIKINVKGKEYTLETDLIGAMLREVDTQKEVVMLINKHCQYNEVDTGFVCLLDEGKYPNSFGLRTAADSHFFTKYDFSDVIAWGYADGGLKDKEQLHYCQRTK